MVCSFLVVGWDLHSFAYIHFLPSCGELLGNGRTLTLGIGVPQSCFLSLHFCSEISISIYFCIHALEGSRVLLPAVSELLACGPVLRGTIWAASLAASCGVTQPSGHGDKLWNPFPGLEGAPTVMEGRAGR